MVIMGIEYFKEAVNDQFQELTIEELKYILLMISETMPFSNQTLVTELPQLQGISSKETDVMTGILSLCGGVFPNDLAGLRDYIFTTSLNMIVKKVQ
jgi:hypothetical protein